MAVPGGDAGGIGHDDQCTRANIVARVADPKRRHAAMD